MYHEACPCVMIHDCNMVQCIVNIVTTCVTQSYMMKHHGVSWHTALHHVSRSCIIKYDHVLVYAYVSGHMMTLYET